MIKDFKTFVAEGRLGRSLSTSFGDKLRSEDGKSVDLGDGRYFYFTSDEDYFADLILAEFNKFDTSWNEPVYEFEDRDGNYVTFLYNEENKEGGYHDTVMNSSHSLSEDDFYKYFNVAICAGLIDMNSDNGEIGFETGYKNNRILLEDNDEEYSIFDSYDDAREEAVNQQKDLLENETDMFSKGSGGKGESLFDRFIRMLGDSWVDYDKLQDWYREDQEQYFGDMDDDELTDYLKQFNIVKETEDFYEVDEDGDIDLDQPKFEPDDYREELINKAVDNFGEGTDLVDNLKLNFGAEFLNNLIKDNDMINYDKLAEEIVDNDGIANNLVQYDGKEVTVDYKGNTYYLYRVQ